MQESVPEYHRECAIPASHPSLPGHFPGQPVVPGVVILDQVLVGLADYLPQARAAGLPNAKFVQPLLPEQTFSIHLRLRADGASVEFECRREGARLAQGRILLQAPVAA